jgi:hypothetical protein
MHAMLRHLQGPWSRLNRQEPFAHRIDGRPHPVARRLKALDGGVRTHLATLQVTDHRVQLVELQLRNVHVAEKGAGKGLELLGGFHQPLQHGIGVHLEHPGRSADAQALSQAGEHADDQRD